MPFRRRKPKLAEATFYPLRCNFDAVGESNYKDQITAVIEAGAPHIDQYDEWTRLGVRFWLIAEPANKHDPNAVAVFADQTGAIKVGYIPRGDAKHMSLSQPEEVYGVIVGRDGNYGVKLDELRVQELSTL